MILSALNDYYEQLISTEGSGIPLRGFSSEKISFEIVLNTSGIVIAVNDIRIKTGKKPTPCVLNVPQIAKRTTGIQPGFLWDKTSYVLGVSAISKRLDNEHSAFKYLHRNALKGTTDDGMIAFANFLESWDPIGFREREHFRDHEDLMDVNVVFRLDGDSRYIHERREARTVWYNIKNNKIVSLGNCLVTGKRCNIARLHPSIKGIKGAQSSGAALVSFNKTAFESYGKEQGDNAPVSEAAVFGYTTALNHLLRRSDGNNQVLQIADASVVFWANGDTPEHCSAAETLFSILVNPARDNAEETARIQSVLAAIRSDEPLQSADNHLHDDTQLFILVISPNVSRLSVRVWHTASLRQIATNLAMYYEDMRIDPSPWKFAPPIWRLQLATAPMRDGKSKADDIFPQLAGEVLRAILTGERFPRHLLSVLIMRMRTDTNIHAMRAALFRAALARDARIAGTTIGIPVSLDLTNTNPGYLLGRLLAILEVAQRAALGATATIRGRYYAKASACPHRTFPLLLRQSTYHLAKLRRERAALAVNLEKEIAAIIFELRGSIPRSLRIEEQGEFAVGYYQQVQSRFVKKANAEDSQDVEESQTLTEETTV